MFCEAVGEAQGLTGAMRAATMLDLGHLVYVSVACLRLIQTYVCEVYPSLGAFAVAVVGCLLHTTVFSNCDYPITFRDNGSLTLEVTNKHPL